jgi:hypothetical protein
MRYTCASKFAPEGQLRLQLAPFLNFPPNKSAGLSARSCVTFQVHEAILWAIIRTRMAMPRTPSACNTGLQVPSTELFEDVRVRGGGEGERDLDW